MTWQGDARRIAALGDYLTHALNRPAERIRLSEFSAGASNPTFRLDLSDASYVLRTKPVGELARGAHAIHREFRVLNALSATGYPSPRPLVYCDDSQIIGSEFYVMEFVPGRSFDDYALPGCAADQRGEIYDSMNQNIARLHALDCDALGLADYGRGGNYFERQIDLWDRQHHGLGLDNKRFVALAERLRPRIPTGGRRALIHGDFTFLNCLVHPAEPRIAAVLDWELSTIGDPLADFAYHLLHWYLPSSPAIGYRTLHGLSPKALGIPTMEDYVARYVSRSGVPIPAADLNFAIAFNLFRMAGIGMGAAARSRLGTAKNSRAIACGEIVDPLIDLANRFLT